MYNTIVVAVDLTHPAQGKALLERGLKLLDAGGSVRILHVLEEIPSYIAAELPRDIGDKRNADAMVELKSIVQDVGAAETVHPEIRSGAPSAQILQCAEDNKADLVMIASHRPGLSDYFIGSTAARVVRHAQCSVLITR